MNGTNLNTLTYLEIMNRKGMQWVMNAFFSVDSFFYLGGFLVSYSTSEIYVHPGLFWSTCTNVSWFKKGSPHAAREVLYYSRSRVQVETALHVAVRIIFHAEWKGSPNAAI
jgi:hypothetical protein